MTDLLIPRTVLDELSALPEKDQLIAVLSLTPREQANVLAALELNVLLDSSDIAGQLLLEFDEHQQIPDWAWSVMLFLAGRGAGKTWTGSAWSSDMAENIAPGLNGCVLGPTRDEIREIMLEGESGLIQALGGDEGTPGTRVKKYNRSTLEVETFAGSVIYARSSERANKIRGLNLNWAWVDEPGSWAGMDAWTNLELAMRTPGLDGNKPKIFVTGTPRRNRLVRHLWARVNDNDDNHIGHMTASMRDNKHLSAAFIAEMERIHGGTQLGEAEIEGRMVDEVEGALWQKPWIKYATWQQVEATGGITDCVIGVDPSGSAEGLGDECGIIVAVQGVNGLSYVVADLSLRGSPGQWIDQILRGFRTSYTPGNWRPSLVVVEGDGNMGGLTKELLGTLDAALPVKLVNTKGVSKQDRARPVAALYEQGRVSHLDEFPVLEDEMTGWVPGEKGQKVGFSPDRVDALVWTLRHLNPSGSNRGPTVVRDQRLVGRR